MIRLPKGRVLQKNLDTTYVRLEGVLQSLNHERFTGYVRAVFEEEEGLLFFRSGELIAANLEHGERKLTGLDALFELLDALRRGRAYLDISKVEDELLRAILALFHRNPVALAATEVPATPRDLAALAARHHLTGAIVVNHPEADRYLFHADGVYMGTFRPDVEEWIMALDLDPLVRFPDRWLLWDCANTETLRTIDLTVPKLEALWGMRDTAEFYVPGFGGYLLDLELRDRNITDPGALPREKFEALAEGLRARCRLLIGDQRAQLLAAALGDHVARIVDAGI